MEQPAVSAKEKVYFVEAMMTEDPKDITNDVFTQSDEPWETIDAMVGFLRDAFAAIGFFCTLIAIALYITGKV